MQSYVIKKDVVQSFLEQAAQHTIEGDLVWPIAPAGFLALYRSSAEHGRAIRIKAEGTAGLGLEGAAADKFDQLCPQGAADLFVSLMVDQECYGNAFLQVIGTEKQVFSLRRLPAITMARHRNGYRQRVLNVQGSEKITTFTADEIIHLRPACPLGGFYALPPWIGAEGMLDLTQAAVKYNAAYFKNHGVPEHAIVVYGQELKEEQQTVIKDFFTNEFQGVDNAHRAIVLNQKNTENRIEFNKLGGERKDGDFINLMNASRDRIIAAHGVPPRLMSIAQAGQLGGGGELAQQLFLFETMDLRPRRRRLLDQLRSLLNKLSIKRADIAFKPLDVTIPTDKTPALANLVQAGIISPDEARELVNDLPDKPIQKSASDTLIDLLSGI